MAADTAYLWEAQGQEVRILEYRSRDSLAVIPDQIEGKAVTALAPYVFSGHEYGDDKEHSHAVWQTGTGERVSEDQVRMLPKVKGDALEELWLPSSLKQVGAYGFYNCQRLRKLKLYSTTVDWGAGVFTGCAGIEEVEIHVDESVRSCLKEILSEIKQTLTVEYNGSEKARLIFPEFFEEAVENTPARILVTNTHGCGQKYRNAFVGTQFQFREYDSLFPHVQVQEPESLVIRLAMGRLMYPCGLAESHKKQYMEYLGEHKIAAARLAVEREENGDLRWLTDQILYETADYQEVIQAAGQKGNLSAVSFLMNKISNQKTTRRRRFTL